MRKAEPFWNKVDVGHPLGCWVWQRALNAYGYGVGREDCRQYMAHRRAYEELIGSIPAGMHLDHLCRNRACVNLEPVTQRVNLLRGRTVTAAHASRTHCPQGHPYSRDNTSVRDGKRYCKQCARDKARARRQRKRVSA